MDGRERAKEGRRRGEGWEGGKIEGRDERDGETEEER